MQLWEYLVLILAVIVGGGLTFLLRPDNRKAIGLILPFSGSYLLGLTIIHLLPDVLEGGGHQIGMWVLVGFLLQLILEHFSKGLEHGHVHFHAGQGAGSLIPLVVGLTLHSFIEGIPLGGFEPLHQHLTHPAEFSTFRHLLTGIVLHKIPAAFALATLLRLANFSRTALWSFLLFFGLSAPFSAFLAEHYLVNTTWLIYSMGIVAGSFLHIGTTILFESGQAGVHQISWQKFLIVLAGFSLSLLSLH